MSDIENKIHKLVFGMSGDELTELGVGLTAMGIFRIREAKGSAEAAVSASSVVAVFSGAHRDLLRSSAAPPPPP